MRYQTAKWSNTRSYGWGVISYYEPSNLLWIESNLNSNKYLHEVLQPEIVLVNASLELSFSKVIHAPMLGRLFETSVQPNICNIFLSLLIRRIRRLLSKCGIWLVSVSLLIRVLELRKTNFNCEYKQNGVIFHKQTFKIWLHAMSYSSTYCNPWWLHQILISDT